MKVEIVFSPSNDNKESYSEIEKKLDKNEIKPNFLFLFLTAGTWKNYNSYTALLKDKFPDTQMLGCIVEGYSAEDVIWTRGVAIMLAEFEGDVKVFTANEKTSIETIHKLSEKVGGGWDSILLMFPAFYFPSKLGFVKFFINDKRYYRMFNKKKKLEDKHKILDKYSENLYSKKMVYPIDYFLRVLSEKTGKSTPIIGMNLMPLEAASNTPIILANYEDMKNGAAVMCFKGETNVAFSDVFPERGNSFEEMESIVKEYFQVPEEVKIIKKGVGIADINGVTPVDFLKLKEKGLKEFSRDDFIKSVEDGKLQMASPYGLAFISRKTLGCIWLGLFNYPLNIFPTIFETDYLYDTAIFNGEVFRGGIKVFGKVLDKKKFNGFDFFIIDQNAIMSFGGDVHKLIDLIKEKTDNSFGIFSSYPSIYLPKPDEKFFSEIDTGICVNLTGTSALLEFI